MKNVFILWSGGLDSTYLIYKNLNEGNKVISGYVSLLNNGKKVDMERQAIEKLKEEFNKEFYNFEYKHI